MNRVTADWVIALPLVGIGVVLWRETLAMPAGPATFPRAVSLLMVALSAWLLLRNLVRQRGWRGIYWSSEGPASGRMVLAVLVLTVGYVYSLGKVSYFLSTAVYFAIMMGMLGLRPRWLVPVGAVGSAVAIYVIFVRLLHVTLR